ncbi:hypothetical protein KXD40_000275 [Peronospora effusa]|nr:hypothetical protein KXD40_000275 [Peronospora effusa]
MVFISLEDVIGTKSSVCADNCTTKRFSENTTRVVVTPGSPAKQHDTLLAYAGLFSSQRPPSLVYFVLYVSDSVMRHKWVLKKTSNDHAQLRKSIQRVGSGCRDPACCGHVQRLSWNVGTRRLWGFANNGKPYDQCNAFQTYVNDLVQAVLGHDNQCQTMKRTRHLLEDFLDIKYHRANAIDRVFQYKNPAASPTVVPVEPCPAGQDCGDTVDDSSECPICCDDLADDTTLRLPCNHNYHAGCVLVWLNIQHTCPVCRLYLDDRVVWNEPVS